MSEVEVPPKDKAARKSKLEETGLISVVTKYFKYAGVAVGVWFMGYMQFSPSWILAGLVLYVWKDRMNKRKQLQIDIRQQIARDEQKAILARVEDLPSWVHFPEVERTEWLNKILDQIWPFIGDYVKDLLMTSIQPKIQSSHSSLGSFQFTRIDLGDIPPRIGGVKVYTERVRRDEIYMDLDIIYSSDCDMEVKLKGITSGVKDLQVRGTMRVIFKPLIGRMPLFGGISVFFLNNPTIDFNLTSLANALDLPGLREMVEDIIIEQIANVMVLPNRIAVPMVQGLNLTLLKYPLPQGVLRIHMLEAKNLKAADMAVIGKAKSDPYAVLKLGGVKYKTKVISNSLNPQWNEIFEAIIDIKDAQVIDIEVRDEDPDKDDSLGTVSLDISTASTQGTLDTWLPLENVKKGDVHIKLVWMYLANDPVVLEKILKQVESENTSELASCILMVNLDSAKDLPRSKKQITEPSPYATITVGQLKQEADEKPNTDSPVWEKPFRFLVHNPHIQKMEVEVLDKKNKVALGTLVVPLKSLLSAPDMTLDQDFRLNNSGVDSKINMRLCLRILTTEYNPAWSSEGELLKSPEAPSTSVDPPPSSSVDQAKSSEKQSKTAEGKPEPKAVEAKPKSAKDEVIVKSTVNTTDSRKPEGQVIPPPSTVKPRDTGSEVRQRKPKSPPAPAESDTRGAHGRGRVQITFRYSTQRQKLVVVIHKCLNLLPCDSDNLADPYIKLYLLPDKSSSGKRKTQVVKNNLNPVFDETFEFQLNQSEIADRDLEVTVKNDTSFFSSNVKTMGVVLIDLSKLDVMKATTEWFDLHPEDSEDADKPTSVESDV